jgi:hypothetical protein
MPKTLQQIALERLQGTTKMITMLFEKGEPRPIMQQSPEYIRVIDAQYVQLAGQHFDGPLTTNVNFVDAHKLWVQFKEAYRGGQGSVDGCKRYLMQCNTEIQSVRV